MKRKYRHAFRVLLVGAVMAAQVAVSAGLQAQTGACRGTLFTIPFSDVPGSNFFFCAIAEAYFSGLTFGTSATTYSPTDPVPREQMAAFITRTLDQSLRRGSRRAALRQWVTLSSPAFVDVGNNPALLECDGADIWVANRGGTVTRVRASDGRVLGTWTGASEAFGVVVAAGRIYVTGQTIPGRLYRIDPRLNGGLVTLVHSDLGNLPNGITCDGAAIWTANQSNMADTGSISRIALSNSFLSHYSVGFNRPIGILYDGSDLWVTDPGDNTLKRVSTFGVVQEAIPVGIGPTFPAFDGTNIWVPNRFSDSVTVVRAVGSLRGTVLATLTGGGLDEPITAAFDGERILVTNLGGHGYTMWKATDLTFLGNVADAAFEEALGACSDGVNFWVSSQSGNRILKF